MQRFHVVNPDAETVEVKPEDMQHVTAMAKEIVELINDPKALLLRALALLDGTAKPLDMDSMLRPRSTLRPETD